MAGLFNKDVEDLGSGNGQPAKSYWDKEVAGWFAIIMLFPFQTADLKQRVVDQV